METFAFDTTDKMLLVATGLLILIQLLYYFCLYNRINQHTRSIKQGDTHFSQELPPISIIVTTCEEVDYLRRNLETVLQQDYPKFEVIVINDNENNASNDFLTLLEDKYSHLYHSFVPDSSRYISRKKLAITLGIKASKYDWLVFTDANCLPQSDQWLRLLARNFTSHTQIVLGYSGYEQGKGWLHKRICYDNLFTAMRYLGFALGNKPYMGIGRNLAYRKELFYQYKGFSAHLNLRRGDDDLFINQASTSENTRVETDANATMRVQPVQRAKEWKEEKINYASTARLYHGTQRWQAGLETTTRLAFYAAWLTTFVQGIIYFHWLVAGIAFFLFILRFTVQAMIVNKTAKNLGEKRRYYFTLPVFDLLQPIQSLRWKLYCILRKRNGFLRK